jgi:anamorsin
LGSVVGPAKIVPVVLLNEIAAENAAKRATADSQLKTLKLGADDLAKVDFTV